MLVPLIAPKELVGHGYREVGIRFVGLELEVEVASELYGGITCGQFFVSRGGISSKAWG